MFAIYLLYVWLLRVCKPYSIENCLNPIWGQNFWDSWENRSYVLQLFVKFWPQRHALFHVLWN